MFKMLWYVAEGVESGRRYVKTNSRKQVMIMARQAAREHDEEITVTAVSEDEEDEVDSIIVRPSNSGDD